MLQSMRDNSQGIVAKILVGLIIVVFALWGVDSLVGLATAKPAPAEVNGQEISETELFRGIDLQRRQVLTQMGDNADPALLDDVVLRQVVLNNLIDRTVQLSHAETSGLFVSDQQLDQMIVTTSEFQVDGRFDRGQFEAALRGAGFTPLSYRELLRKETLLNQLRTSFDSSAFMTGSEVEELLRLNTQTRDIRVARFAADQTSVEVSDADVQASYEALGDQLLTEEQAIVDFVVLDQAKFLNTDSVTDDDISDAYLQLVASFDGKEERKARHILLEINEGQGLESALSLASDIRQKLSEGESFSDLAAQYSQDIGSADSGGDLGYLTPGLFAGPFDDALFSLNTGEVSQPVETEFGIHLIKVDDIRGQTAPEISEVREDLRSDVAEANAEKEYVAALERLTDLAFSSGDLVPIAEELGLEIQTSDAFSRSGGSSEFADQKLVRAAFSDVVIKEGLNSDPVELNRGRTFVLNLNELQPARRLSLDEVRDDITERLKREVASSAALESARSALANGASNVNLEWALISDLSRGQIGDLEPEVVDTAFAMPKPQGDLRSYEVVQLNDGSAAIVSVDAIGQSQDVIGDEIRTQVSRMLSRSEGSEAFRAYFEHLKSSAEIAIN